MNKDYSELTLWDKEEVRSLKSGRLSIPGRGTVNANALRQERAQGAGERWEGAVRDQVESVSHGKKRRLYSRWAASGRL